MDVCKLYVIKAFNVVGSTVASATITYKSVSMHKYISVLFECRVDFRENREINKNRMMSKFSPSCSYVVGGL